MNVAKTHEVSFLAADLSGHLLTVQAGIPAPAALSFAADLLATVHGLLLAAEEIDSEAARSAAILLTEMAGAVINAAAPTADSAV